VIEDKEWFCGMGFVITTITYLEGGDGSATDANVLIDGSGERDDGRDMAGSVVVSRSSPQLLGLGLGGRLSRW
jgi:hypothetical protein